ncbi:AraC-like ligand-binding domain-containing protein [Sinosporangium siamense]|uniref:AraC family transcriptional regulator n=1 Tax=Sinosporangium siamense TaxID=1367973 RepID=A0A919V7J7_9ACTN|nr:helix-turn-helix domain-containing protein [Sinosporangium siamense]GII92162.1 AraC family transcriptional regulator [Sinosporangium siamense]
MLAVSVFTTADCLPADRFDCWQELISETHSPVHLHLDDRGDFRASARVLALGTVSLWPTTCDSMSMHRTPRLIRRSDPEHLHLSVPLTIPVHVRHGDESGTYRPGDICVFDSSRPYDLRLDKDAGSYTELGMEIPKAHLPLPWDKVKDVIPRALPAREGYGALLAHFLKQTVKDAAHYGPADAPRLELIAVDLVSALLTHAVDAESALAPESRTRTLTARIDDFIERHLGDHALTPAAIAAHHHISVRYLQRLFQQQDRTVMGWVRRRRLELAREDLTRYPARALSVRAAALRRGFTSHSDFSRAFRAAYGMSPSEYRLLARRDGHAGPCAGM